MYGLIFLFRYVEDDFIQQESTCPDHVWFANQTTGNACATVALLNIIMNIPNVDLGENLHGFKEFTEGFTPATRGEQIVHYEFVKNIHNSFARCGIHRCPIFSIEELTVFQENRHDEHRPSNAK